MDIEKQASCSGLLSSITTLVDLVSKGGGQGTSLKDLKSAGVAKAGSGLELWVKHFLARTIGYANPVEIQGRWRNVYSFLGGTNNPPDLMIRGSYAIEVKKSEVATKVLRRPSSLQLNSSFPNRILSVDDPRLQRECLDAESWRQKPFIYVFGLVDKQTSSVRSLWLVDGRCISDLRSSYEAIIRKIQAPLTAMGSEATNELGRFNRVDALGQTSLRVRGMWQLVHPAISLQKFLIAPGTRDFVFNCVLPENDFILFPEDDIAAIRIREHKGLMSSCRAIPDPTNANLSMQARIISGCW